MHGTAQKLSNLETLRDNDLIAAVTPDLEKVAAQFAIAITPAMADLIDTNDPVDPIAAQFVPSASELETTSEELADPIGDTAFSPVEGIVHRYPDRVLLKPSHLCAVYCRFCFRREQIGETGNMLSAEALEKAIGYIREHKEIWEVILSGGDPLLLSDARLEHLVSSLNEIEHVKVIRIHTRIPAVDPARITAKLVKILRGRAATYVVLHCNHPRELKPAARNACSTLIDAGIPMLSQSVLLRGVNDNAATLAELMRAFVETRIKPYYLHHADMARGTGHFRVPLVEGQGLMRALRGHVSGLCQPTYVLDIPGGHGKVPVGPVYAESNDGEWTVTDYRGCAHDYREHG